MPVSGARLKILCFIETDLEIRHFLQSGALQPLFEHHDVKLVFPPDGYRRIKCDIATLNLSTPIERVGIPDERQAVWKYAFHHDQMQIRIGYGWWRLWKVWWRQIGWKAALMFSLANLPVIRPTVRRHWIKALAQVPATDLEALLDREQPDLLLHPSCFAGCFINDLIVEGKKRGIPTVLLMNSWDNPSIKRATSGKPDWVAVWGEQTRRHTAHFMGIPPERIVILGAAQFDIYRGPPRITPAQFRQEHGIPLDNKVLLYAGSSKGCRESLHLEWLNDAIAAGDLGKLTVVYRPHPWGISRQEAETILSAKWPHVRIENSMREFLEHIRQGTQKEGFMMAEYARTHDVLSSVDAVISPLSTIILESALHGLPVMCFFPSEEEKISHWRGMRKLVHFEDLYKSPGVIVADSYAAFLPKTKDLLKRAGDHGLRKELAQQMTYFVQYHQKKYGEGLLELVSIAAGPRN